MHRARHTAHSSVFRPRLLIALVVAAVGLSFALWLPARNDNASATENGREPGQSQGDHRRDRTQDRDHRRDRRRESPSASPPSSASPSPSASYAGDSASPSASPSPSPTPTSEAPKATEWAPFTDYVAGQLVKFKGVDYQVQQTHTSLPGWEPTALPTLFKALG
jgi:cytoskeletal protein RodZ